MSKRLFIFAAYDKDSIIDETLFYNVKDMRDMVFFFLDLPGQEKKDWKRPFVFKD